jgi:hypothetical protein
MSSRFARRATGFGLRRLSLFAVAALACTPLESASDWFAPEGSAGSGGEAGTVSGSGGASGAAGNGGAGSGGNGGGSGESEGGRSGHAGASSEAGDAGKGDTSGAGGEAGESAGGTGGSGECPPPEARELIELGPGEVVIDQDTHWNCGSVRLVRGTLLVSAGVTLTIEAGSLVQVSEGGLVLVQRRGRLVASGSAERPIVFTSAKRAGERAPGDWRGLVLIGDGPSHVVNAPVYNTLGDGRADFGGGPEGDASGSCGTLRYVRVEFAGGNLDEAANPGAALTLAGCGTGTDVAFVQVHRGTDGLGLVGGNVALEHVLVSANARGDAIEWTGGYRGRLQFVVAQSLGAATALLGSNSEANPSAEPISAPEIYNALLAGSAPLVSGAHFGAALQFGSRAKLKNSVILGFADAAFDLRLPAETLENDVGPDRLVDISHVLLHANARDFTSAAEVLAGMPSLRSGDPGLAHATDRAAPLFLPLAQEVLIEPAPVPQPFDTTAAFRGAMAPGGADWTLGWTAFPSD